MLEAAWVLPFELNKDIDVIIQAKNRRQRRLA